MKIYKAVGLMSGTSLDGIDLAYCEFYLENGGWKYDLPFAETYPYDADWKNRLQAITEVSALQLLETDIQLGGLFGQKVSAFIKKHDLKPDLVASHGHTVFHQPDRSVTLQIGSNYEIMKSSGSPVIGNFRTLDVALGGQGAPLVPAGDKLLFSEYAFCLNLGGISNISFDRQGERLAFDVTPNNLILNALANHLGRDYDDGGKLAQSGKLDERLFGALNEAGYYKKELPKSMGIELIREQFFPAIQSSSVSIEDKLCTVNYHIAYQIDKAIKKNLTPSNEAPRLLVTGGGAYNEFLLKLLSNYAEQRYRIVVPGDRLINFKEALVFAFLGVLRWRNEINVFSSVTGATKDTSSGLIYYSSIA